MEPSAFFLEQRERLRAAAAAGPVADLACGRGRHSLAAAADGARVVGIDRNAAALAELRREARARRLAVAALRADLECGAAIPLRPGSCAAVLVFRYLHRPLVPAIEALLQPGGLLLYETFTRDQRDLPCGPRNPAFLLAPGELAQLFGGLEILACWEGRSGGDAPAALARLVARKPG